MSKHEKLFGSVRGFYFSVSGRIHFAVVRRLSEDYIVFVSPRFAKSNASHLWFRRFRDGSYRQVANPR